MDSRAAVRWILILALLVVIAGCGGTRMTSPTATPTPKPVYDHRLSGNSIVYYSDGNNCEGMERRTTDDSTPFAQSIRLTGETRNCFNTTLVAFHSEAMDYFTFWAPQAMVVSK